MTKTFVVCVAVVTLFGHYTLNLQRKVDQLEAMSKLSIQKDKLDNDQIRDLMYSVQQLTTKNETLKTEGFVQGVVSAVNRPNYYQSIWHAGYDRGSEVMADMAESKKKSEVMNTNFKTEEQ